jgi:hypothetical protein
MASKSWKKPNNFDLSIQVEELLFNKKRIAWQDKQDTDFDKTVKMIEVEQKKLEQKNDERK